ncbi:hypothetical protein AB1Y20_005535 [Prymnesium parvum]|uniref:Centrosomal protein of 162 kDa n=1 Tax=Prymnesium parvum TaxID=97485 RepID=A0AB34J6M1_PRYPA
MARELPALPSAAGHAQLEARISESVAHARNRLNALQAEMAAVQSREARERAELQRTCDSLSSRLELEAARAISEGEGRHRAELAAAASAAALQQERGRREAVEASLGQLRLHFEAELTHAQRVAAEAQRAESGTRARWEEELARAQQLARSQLDAMRLRAERAEAEVLSAQQANGEFRREAEVHLAELRERLLSFERQTQAAEAKAAEALEERDRAVEASARKLSEEELAAVWDRVAAQQEALEAAESRAELAHAAQLEAEAEIGEMYAQINEREQRGIEREVTAEQAALAAAAALEEERQRLASSSYEQLPQLQALAMQADSWRKRAEVERERRKTRLQTQAATLPTPPMSHSSRPPPALLSCARHTAGEALQGIQLRQLISTAALLKRATHQLERHAAEGEASSPALPSHPSPTAWARGSPPPSPRLTSSSARFSSWSPTTITPAPHNAAPPLERASPRAEGHPPPPPPNDGVRPRSPPSSASRGKGGGCRSTASKPQAASKPNRAAAGLSRAARAKPSTLAAPRAAAPRATAPPVRAAPALPSAASREDWRRGECSHAEQMGADARRREELHAHALAAAHEEAERWKAEALAARRNGDASSTVEAGEARRLAWQHRTTDWHAVGDDGVEGGARTGTNGETCRAAAAADAARMRARMEAEARRLEGEEMERRMRAERGPQEHGMSSHRGTAFNPARAARTHDLRCECDQPGTPSARHRASLNSSAPESEQSSSPLDEKLNLIDSEIAQLQARQHSLEMATHQAEAVTADGIKW